MHLWFPLGHSLGKVSRCLRESGISHEFADNERALVAHLESGNLSTLAGLLDDVMSVEEQQAARALLLPSGGRPEYRDFGRVASLSQLIARSSAGWLLDILRDMRLTSHFQSIVHTGEPHRRYAREGLLRGVDRSGGLIAPHRMYQVARDADLLFQLDLAARRTVISELDRHHVIGDRIFINFTPTSIYDPAFCLRSTVAAIDGAGIPHDHIIFEVVETERTDSLDHLRSILEFYRSEGFGVALDDVGAGYSSLNLVHQLRPDYIKLDMELVRDVEKDAYKAAVAGKLIEIAADLGIESIAEGVESASELTWLQERGATYAQGFFIGRPAPLGH